MLLVAAYSLFVPTLKSLNKIEARSVRVMENLLAYVSCDFALAGSLMRWWWKDKEHLSWSNYETIAIALIAFNAVLYVFRFYARRKQYYVQLQK
jgi:hypothetical protein